MIDWIERHIGDPETFFRSAQIACGFFAFGWFLSGLDLWLLGIAR